MAIRVKEINGKNYMYFIHYPNGKKVDVYCGVESNPESRKKALTMEIEATKRQISKLNRKLEGLTSQFEKVCEESAITPPPQRNSQQQTKSISLKQLTSRILHGDCLDVMRRMPDQIIKIVVTSPPYNIKNSTGNGLKNGYGGKWPNAALQGGYDGHDDCMDHDDYVAWQRECLTEMMRVLRSDGAIFYNHKWRVQNGIMQDRHDILDGFPVRQIIIWHRSGGINFNPGYFLPNYEVVYLIAKPDFKLAPKTNGAGCVWKINQETGNPHPAPFPVDLASRCIQAAGEGPVLDPFMGSGTTAIAAEMADVDWIGIEKSADYVSSSKSEAAAAAHNA